MNMKIQWQVIVQQPAEFRGEPVPGYVQVDDISGGVNRWSKSPKQLQEEDCYVPDFTGLPTGKYSWEGACAALRGQRLAGLRKSGEALDGLLETITEGQAI
jgi:hypothetical protein